MTTTSDNQSPSSGTGGPITGHLRNPLSYCPDVFRSIIKNQEPLGEKFQKVLDDNREDLYVETRDIEALSKRFCKLAGICWHESKYEWENCPVPHYGYNPNPDFRNPIEVLKVMDKAGKLDEFILSLIIYGPEHSRVANFCRKYLLNTSDSLLLQEAHEFLKLKGGR